MTAVTTFQAGAALPLPDRPAVELARLLRAGEVSAREVLAAHVERIDAVDPQVNALVTRCFERAAAEAAAADQRLARGEPLGLLHGLPVAHKDLNVTAGIRTTLGSPLFADWVPDIDALVVSRARAAGAITVGKTNTPELGAGSHTFNPVFGVTRNPWDTSRACGGSSGGAAVALACGMVPLADGSDMGGSLRNPANFCGVVGLRPSPGRCPTWPTRSAWGALAVDGPMARNVADLALYLRVLAGPDPRSPLSLPESGDELLPTGWDAPPGRLRVAWSPRLGGLPVEADVLAVVEGVLPTLDRLGWHVEAADPPLTGADEVFEVLRAVQFEAGYGALYDRAAAQMKATVQGNIEAGRRLSGPDVGRAERLRGECYVAMADFFTRYDLLVGVVSQVAPFPVEVEYPEVVEGQAMGSYIEWMRSCSRVSVTACPALSLPVGTTAAGLPVGVQLVGRHRGERQLLRAALALEAAVGWAGRRPPLVAGGAPPAG